MKTLLRYLGYILIISSFFRVIPIVTALIYQESFGLFVLTFLLSLFLGIGLLMIERRMEGKETSLSLKHGLLLVALSFIILPSISSISFLPYFNYNPIDALFESISGFTTTGLTLFSSLNGLPKSLLLWRAETQWIGGIGILMIFLFIFSRLKSHSYSEISETESQSKTGLTLYQAQGFPEKLEPGLKDSSKHILIIYGAYTLIGIVLLLLVGLPLFDALAMTFTSLSTGGFSVSDQFYSSWGVLSVLSLLMIIGSISFITHNKLLQRKFKEFFLDFEKNIFLGLMVVVSGIVLFVYTDIKVVLFEIISAFTTTGYSLVPISLLPQIFIMMIMLGMIVGGSIASTAGGMKVFRIYYLGKSINWLLRKLAAPASAIIPFKIKDKPVDENNLLILHIFFFSYVFILLAGTITFMFLGYSFQDSSFQVTSALGTVGLQTMELESVPVIGKMVLMFAMLLGRLEIFPLLLLIKSLFIR